LLSAFAASLSALSLETRSKVTEIDKFAALLSQSGRIGVMAVVIALLRSFPRLVVGGWTDLPGTDGAELAIRRNQCRNRFH
jgi:hypothetical protein